ncbi:MAG: peptidase transporter [Paucimonas sp.]|nr:peptidase transporter [Paucimonas sp.]
MPPVDPTAPGKQDLHHAPHDSGVPGVRPLVGVQVEHLAFRHAGRQPYVFSTLSMDIAPGALVAAVGPAGCGKTTLVQLIQGLHRPACGTIALVQAPQQQQQQQQRLPVAAVRIAVVTRDPMLFGGSILGNLLMANPRAAHDSVIKVCQQAGVHEAILSLPAAYQTEMGEHGNLLCQGLRQCISVARALLREPDILVLDDVFACVDDAWSQQLAAALNALKGRLTVLLAARRLPSGLKLDTVYRLDPMRTIKLAILSGLAQARPPLHEAGRGAAGITDPDRAGRGLQ